MTPCRPPRTWTPFTAASATTSSTAATSPTPHLARDNARPDDLVIVDLNLTVPQQSGFGNDSFISIENLIGPCSAIT